jgi:hypothetical protein
MCLISLLWLSLYQAKEAGEGRGAKRFSSAAGRGLMDEQNEWVREPYTVLVILLIPFKLVL